MHAIRCLLGLLLLLGITATVQAQDPDVLRAAQREAAESNHAAVVARLEAAGLDALTPQGAHLLGRSYQAMLQHERAATAFERADTTKTAVLVDWGQSLERLGLPEEAEARYRTAYRRDSTNQYVAANLARLLSDRDAWDEVASIYARLVEVDPLNSYLQAQLGTAYARLDSTDQAIVHYERAHALTPRNIKVVLALTKVYYDIDYILSATRVLERALAARPESAALWRRTGEFALKEEQYREAAVAFDNVLRFSRDSTAKDLSHLGVSLYLKGDYDKALDYLQLSFNRDEEDALNAFYLGLAYHQGGDYDEAIRYLQHAADGLGQGLLANVQARMGNTYEQTNREPDAIRAYRLSLNMDPARVEVLFHLAGVYDSYYADKNMALEQYERFLESVSEDALPQMQKYARQRVQEIREKQFFEEGRPPPSQRLDTLVILPPDSSGGRDR